MVTLQDTIRKYQERLQRYYPEAFNDTDRIEENWQMIQWLTDLKYFYDREHIDYYGAKGEKSDVIIKGTTDNNRVAGVVKCVHRNTTWTPETMIMQMFKEYNAGLRFTNLQFPYILLNVKPTKENTFYNLKVLLRDESECSK